MNTTTTHATHAAHDTPRPVPVELRAHFARMMKFSRHTFGPGARTAGVTQHIEKELVEVRDNPADLSEWADLWILATDGMWRAAHYLRHIETPDAIADVMVATILAKQVKNERRTWPDWRNFGQDQAIEHDRTGEPPKAPRRDQQAPAADYKLPVETAELTAEIEEALRVAAENAKPMEFPNIGDTIEFCGPVGRAVLVSVRKAPECYEAWARMPDGTLAASLHFKPVKVAPKAADKGFAGCSDCKSACGDCKSACSGAKPAIAITPALVDAIVGNPPPAPAGVGNIRPRGWRDVIAELRSSLYEHGYSGASAASYVEGQRAYAAPMLDAVEDALTELEASAAKAGA